MAVTGIDDGWLGLFDYMAGNWLLPLGALGTALFVGWRVPSDVRESGFKSGSSFTWLYWGWVQLLRFIIPLALAAILFMNALDLFTANGANVEGAPAETEITHVLSGRERSLQMVVLAAPLTEPPEAPAAPDVEGPWVRPAAAASAQPVWGHAEGLRVGLHPLVGPRGLLRIYAPHLERSETWPINYIAVEPIVEGADPWDMSDLGPIIGPRGRGFSELEPSGWDEERGKRFWSSNSAEDNEPRRPQKHPARGVITQENGVEVLHVYIHIEPFENGARPLLRLAFREDRPDEVGITAFAHDDSAPMAYCILSATMGNHARLRRLHLQQRIAESTELWSDYRGDAFTEHVRFRREEIFTTPDGAALVAATPDENNPEHAEYPERTAEHWRYRGKLATQYWRDENPGDELAVQVNGRYTYWMSQDPIPGGISYENFELVHPFEDGKQLWFGIAQRTPEELGLP